MADEGVPDEPLAGRVHPRDEGEETETGDTPYARHLEMQRRMNPGQVAREEPPIQTVGTAVDLTRMVAAGAAPGDVPQTRTGAPVGHGYRARSFITRAERQERNDAARDEQWHGDVRSHGPLPDAARRAAHRIAGASTERALFGTAAERQQALARVVTRTYGRGKGNQRMPNEGGGSSKDT